LIEHKRVREYKIKRNFKKSESMFKDWTEDNTANMKKGF
jgi:hypothetical protein